MWRRKKDDNMDSNTRYELSDREKETFLTLIIYDIIEKMNQRGKKMAKMIDAANNANAPGGIYDAKCRCLEDLDYYIAKINFVEDIEWAFNLTTTFNITTPVYKLRGEELLEEVAGNNFNWKEHRYYTCKEQDEIRKRTNEMAKEFIGMMKVAKENQKIRLGRRQENEGK
jgi:hypothetical protein